MRISDWSSDVCSADLLIGHGVNPVTGDYSRGAAGFLIENGKLGPPVAEITIAGNLREMFMHLTPASDLEFRRAVDVPTLRIDGMKIGRASCRERGCK